MSNEDATADEERPPVGSLAFLFMWLSIGVQSFGGGAATLTLIRRMAVEREKWLSDEEFTSDWAVCQMAPGINLLALTLLLGNRVAGLRGMLLALMGLLFPTAAITVLLTAFYAPLRNAPIVEAALKGVIPATVGLGLITSMQMVRPVVVKSSREGWVSGLFSLALLGGSVLFRLLGYSVISILLAAAALSALYHWMRSSAGRGSVTTAHEADRGAGN